MYQCNATIFSHTETECFELSITKAQGEGGTFKSTKVSCSFHIVTSGA